MEGIETEYDVILVGTGITEAILAGAFSRVGKKVLHLDKNDFYGQYHSSFNLASFDRIISESINKSSVNESKAEESKDESISFSEQMQQPTLQLNHCESTFLNVKTAETPVIEEKEQPKEGEAIENPPEVKIPAPVLSKEKLLEESRLYSIDVLPKIQFSSGPETELLVASGVARYLEFRPLDSIYVYFDNEMQLVPCSKSDVFKTKSISLLEKRLLSKFITLIQNEMGEKQEESEDQKSEETQETLPKQGKFIEMLKSQGLTPKLAAFVLYGIAFLEEDQNDSENPFTTAMGMEFLKKFVSSLGRYGNSPFLCPLYGYSELCQAYCRLGAVYGATYMLKVPVREITIKDGVCKGVVDPEGHQYHCSTLVVGADYAEKFMETSKQNFISRCVCITNASLKEAEGQILLTIPPKSIGNKFTIKVLQYNSDMSVCPKGKFLVHITTTGTNNPKQDLEPVLKMLFKSDPSAPENKPLILYTAYFSQPCRVPKSSGIPSNMYICKDSTASIDNDDHVEEAKKIFFSVLPGEKFLPKAHSEEDFVWEEEPVTQEDAKERVANT